MKTLSGNIQDSSKVVDGRVYVPVEEYFTLLGKAEFLLKLSEKLIDTSIDHWHEKADTDNFKLHDWLGLGWNEYKTYVEKGLRGFVTTQAV